MGNALYALSISLRSLYLSLIVRAHNLSNSAFLGHLISSLFLFLSFFLSFFPTTCGWWPSNQASKPNVPEAPMHWDSVARRERERERESERETLCEPGAKQAIRPYFILLLLGKFLASHWRCSNFFFFFFKAASKPRPHPNSAARTQPATDDDDEEEEGEEEEEEEEEEENGWTYTLGLPN
jgi:hypothetical protein